MHTRLVALAVASLLVVSALPALAQPLPSLARATQRCS